MIDRFLLRTPQTAELVKKKEPTFPFEHLVALDVSCRQLQRDIEQLRHAKNELSGTGPVSDAVRAQSQALSEQLKEKERAFAQTEKEFQALYLACPNIPDASVPAGGKQDNVVVAERGVKPHFTFEPQHHLALATKLGWLDFEGAALLSGSQFPLYKGALVRLVYGLAHHMLKHNATHGFELVLPPALVHEQSLVVTGNFPKFADQVYAIPADGLYAIPTAEVPLVNMYSNKILAPEQLPIRVTAWTSCFRREAGGYGATERGLIRVHQFEKVELVALCTPAMAAQEHERMLTCATQLLDFLGLQYRVVLLAAQDCSFASAKTYDLEVWLPGQKIYSEVSSISWCTDFQARRGLIRYKAPKAQLVHTLNGSSLALSRVMVALLETYQQADGSIVFPEHIQKLMW